MDDGSPGGADAAGADDECDHCGATLPPSDTDGRRTCLYCGTTTRVPPPSPAPDAGPTATSVVRTDPVEPSHGAANRGCAAPGVVVLVVVAIAAIGAAIGTAALVGDVDIADIGGSDGPDLSISGEAALVLPGEPADPLDVVALTYHYDPSREESVHEVARFDGDDGPRWRGPALAESAYQVPLALAGDVVVTADGDDVVGLAVADGTERWRTTVSDEVTWTCERCVATVGDRAVVTPTDGVLHALDTATGAVAWTRRYDDVRAPTYAVGDRVVAIDGTGGDHRLLVLSPADGAELAAVEPSCTMPDGRGSAEGVDPDTTVLPLADGGVVLGYGTWPGCWERRDLATGELRWQVVLPETSFSWDLAAAHDGTTLVAADGDGGIVVVDLATGEHRSLAAPPDTEWVPVAATGQGPVVAARSTRGSPDWAVALIDPADGTTRWSHPLGDAEPALDTFGATTIVSSNESQVAVHATDGGVDLVTIDGDTGDLAVERLDLATGAATGGGTVDRPEMVGALRFVPLAWSGGRAALLVGDQIVVVDLTTATVQDVYGG